MKKVLTIFMVLALALSMSLSAFAAPSNFVRGNGKSALKQTKTEQAVQQKTSAKTEQAKKKELKKQQRLAAVKAAYSEEELAEFNSAADLIEQTEKDAKVLEAGSIIVKNNLIKLDTPAYIKGERTLIPVRAITAQLGAEVTWDQETKTVTISKDGIEVVMTIDNVAVTVNGTEVQMDVPPEITCSRTYVPLRFLAETFGLYANWNADDGTIDIGDGTTTDDTATGDTATGDTATGDTTTDDTATDDTTTGDTTTGDTTTGDTTTGDTITDGTTTAAE